MFFVKITHQSRKKNPKKWKNQKNQISMLYYLSIIIVINNLKVIDIKYDRVW